HYINLNEDEIDWLCQTNEIKKNQILEILKKLKETGFEKSNEVRKIEDKLTMNFQSINYLENKINNFFKDNPSFRPDRHIWSEHYENSKLPADITRYIQMLFKKKKRHVFLLQNQKKSLLCTRLPYKTFAYLLHATEGVLSVQLLRIIEKLSQEV
ncbi:MAG: hypothetical protein OEV44_03685, partial [Spirochaetota bacterium]|nr:hypothetical protein [Spirochaetota bacterium]